MKPCRRPIEVTQRVTHWCVTILAVSLLSACPGPEENATDTGSNQRTPEPVIDMGSEPDVPPAPLGELCHVKVTVGSDTRLARPTLEVYDITADRPIALLDRSSSGNHYFDAPLGHDVAFTVVPAAGVPVAPLTYRATVDQRCESLGMLEFFTPVGLTLEQVDRGTSSEALPPTFADVEAGLLFVRGVQRWHAIETTENPNFAIGNLQTDATFAELPADVRFRSLGAGVVLAETTSDVSLFRLDATGLTTVSSTEVTTPLQDVVAVDDERAIVRDGSGMVHELLLNDGSLRSVGEGPQQAVSTSDDAIWMLDGDGTVRRVPFGGTSAEIGALPGAMRITVNASDSRILGWFGTSCELWEDRCEVALYDTADLTAVVDVDAEPIGAQYVLAAASIGDHFVLADAPSSVRVIHIEDDQIIEGESIAGAPDAERSTILAQAMVVVTDQQTTFVRSSTDSAAFEEGSWTLLPRTDDYIELVAQPCHDPLSCERVLWFSDLRGRATQPGSALMLGRDLDIAPEVNSDAYQRIDFVRDGERAPTSWSVTMEPLFVPSGAPCLPIIDTIVAVERFTPVEQAVHCITWWNS